jgi:hypothetical protein
MRMMKTSKKVKKMDCRHYHEFSIVSDKTAILEMIIRKLQNPD